MKHLFILLITLPSILFAQEKSYEQRLLEAEKQVEQEAQILKEEMENDDEFYLNKALEIEFTVDTFKVEELLRRQLDIDYSTYGMVNATMIARDNYDKLLNKYSQQLLKKLSVEDQEVLKDVQRNWIQFRDSEIELIGTVSKEEYSGGGTIQRIINSGRVYNLTRSRAIEIFDHLLRISEE